MAICYDRFLKWAKEHFGEENLSYAKSGEEICAPSPFEHDEKTHLWMNPSGGKSKHPENGSYRCWYTDKSGSLVSLVSELEGIPYEDAEAKLYDKPTLAELTTTALETFGRKQVSSSSKNFNQTNAGLVSLPPDCYHLEGSESPPAKRVQNYLLSRKIRSTDFYYSYAFGWSDRVIIPYRNNTHQLVWYNARDITEKQKLRYRKPETGVDTTSQISQENVLFEAPGSQNQLELTLVVEGEFDAMSLAQSGISSVACGGKKVSSGQWNQLKLRKVVLAFDNDSKGAEAVAHNAREYESLFGRKALRIRPPHPFKDWNAFLIKESEKVILSYVQKNVRPVQSLKPSF